MRLTWFGHAAFLIETEGARTILDPYRSPDCGGYAPVDESADFVVVSHDNDKYHSHIGQIRSPFEVLKALEFPPNGVERGGLRFQAVPVFETPEKLPGDEVTIIHFRAEGLHVVHLGDLGHALSEAELAPLRGADIVLASVGGPPTIDLPLLRELLEAIGPKVVIPMHYLVPGKINLKIQPIETFLEMMSDWPVTRPGASSLTIGPHERLSGRSIVSLEPAR